MHSGVLVGMSRSLPFLGLGRKLVFVLPGGLGIASPPVPYFPGKASKRIGKSIVPPKLPFLRVPPRQGARPHARSSGSCAAWGLARCIFTRPAGQRGEPPAVSVVMEMGPWLDGHRLVHTFPGRPRPVGGALAGG